MQNDLSVQNASKTHPAKYAGITLICAAILVCSFFCDRSVEQFVLQHQVPALLHVARELSRYGEWFYLLLPALLLLVVGDLSKNRRWMTLGLALALSSGIAGVSATAIRFSTGRTRPSATVTQGWYGIRHDGQWLPGRSQYNSFPSGPRGIRDGIRRGAFSGHAALENSGGADPRGDRLVANLSGSASLLGRGGVGDARRRGGDLYLVPADAAALEKLSDLSPR